VLASALVSLGVRLRWFSPHPWLWQAGDWRQSPWTLWTAPLVSITPFHTFGNVLALVAVGVLGHAVGARLREALALLVAWPLTTLGLLCWPAVEWYAGLSGVIHAAAAIVAWRALTQRSARGIGAWLAAGLLIKLLLERGWVAPIAFDIQWGFNVVRAAHLSGAAAGLIAAAAVDAAATVVSRWRRRQR
ncbi:MAG: rhomboid family intramembrane serine protease, partial [Comamonas sp.]|nr:rhomboid family intramembrane serine protease [Comamonas sp.]